MASPTVNFLSYNSTGMNSIKIEWIRDLCKLCSIDYFSIQEHFISRKGAEKYFNEQFDQYSSYAIPAVKKDF